MEQRIEDNTHRHRIYVNTFTQRTAGDDIRCTIDLGRDYSWQELSFDTVCVESKFINWYRTRDADYRYLDFIYAVADEDPVRVSLRVDQYVDLYGSGDFGLANVDGFQGYLERKTGVRFNVSTRHGKLYFVDPIVVDGEVPLTSFEPVGDGWLKVGFKKRAYELVDETDAEGTAIRMFKASSLYDFAGPPVILVSMDQVSGSGLISNSQGTHVFALDNQVPFGARATFTNTQQKTCNIIYNAQRQSIRYLTISILGCDQFPLETPADDEGVFNRNDLELIMVMSIR